MPFIPKLHTNKPLVELFHRTNCYDCSWYDLCGLLGHYSLECICEIIIVIALFFFVSVISDDCISYFCYIIIFPVTVMNIYPNSFVHILHCSERLILLCSVNAN